MTKKIYICTIGFAFLIISMAMCSPLTIIDMNQDGLQDTWIYSWENGTMKLEQDVNGDGMPDLWVYSLDEKTKKMEQDSNYDGTIDTCSWFYVNKGVIQKSELDSNYDGQLDYCHYFRDGEVLRKETK